LVTAALIAAMQTLQLTLARDGATRQPVSDAFPAAEVRALEATGPTKDEISRVSATAPSSVVCTPPYCGSARVATGGAFYWRSYQEAQHSSSGVGRPADMG
ncbi:MAG TPA: hypothetical protein VJ233_11230, partial [Hyphomicrobiaceae bacterium]|nr:hypothetical protein [Hyphomicrobiaceae bacterium]